MTMAYEALLLKMETSRFLRKAMTSNLVQVPSMQRPVYSGSPLLKRIRRMMAQLFARQTPR